jgi:hypothetical protein
MSRALLSIWQPLQTIRQEGRVEEADAVSADLSKLFAAADPDYPLLVGLQASRGRN